MRAPATRRLRCGQAVEIGSAVASIIGVAVLWLLFKEAWDPLKAEADTQVTNATAQTATDWIGLGFGNFLVITLGITVLGVIAFSVFQQQGGL